MTRQEMLDRIYQINGDWITIMIADDEERDYAWEEYVERVEVMTEEQLQAEFDRSIELESKFLP